MEWVETTGRTIEDAKEAALDQLGIDESEVEFEVLEEPKTGLFGRPRGEARIKARVRPKAPRPKQERRARKPRDGAKRGNGSTNGSKAKNQNTDSPKSEKAAESSGSKQDRAPKKQEGSHMTDDEVPVGVQADIITEFLEGLLTAFEVEGIVTRTVIDDDTIELSVDGNDLGLLIGPKGQTLTAIHELSRTVLQRRATGRHMGRVRIDIGGYRHRRQEALARFVQQQAEGVLANGSARALEPMNSADRKVVHDTVNGIDGVETISEGADPARRVVIVPTQS